VNVQRIPWLPYPMISLMKSILVPICEAGSWPTVFEWGAGGSTLWFADNGCKVTTAEHDRAWYAEMFRQVAQLQVRLKFVPPTDQFIRADRADPMAYYSQVLGEKSLQNYAAGIDNYGQFDIVLVDGRARPSCLYHAVPKHIKPGGWVILDNTGDRPYYLEQTDHLFEGWEVVTAKGYGPLLDYPWEAKAWQRPKEI